MLSRRILNIAVSTALLSGCSSVLGLDDFTAGPGTGDGGGPTTSTADTTTSTTDAASASSSTSSSTTSTGGDGGSDGGGGGTSQGGAGGAEAVCGDDQLGGDERCDGEDLGGQTCEDLGYPEGGDLGCLRDCTDWDRSGCIGIPAPTLRRPMANAYVGTYLAPDTLRPRFAWEVVDVGADAPTEYTLEIAPADADGQPDFTAAESFPAGQVTEFQPATPIDVSETIPVGSVVYWRVTACVGELCSEPSRPRRMHLGRARKDGNGDGIADVIVGLDRNPPEVDGTRYFFCTPSNLGLTRDLPGVRSSFLGDINGDGFADVASAGDGGVVNIFFGAPQGAFPATPSMTLQAPAGDPGAGFYVHVAGAGDMDDDGFDDVVITAPGAPGDPGSAAGRAWIFRGGETVATAPVRTIIGSADDFLGVNARGLVGTDIDGDGFSDLLLGGPYNPDGGFGQGKVIVVFGGEDLSATDTDTLVGQADNDQYGDQVAVAGDVNGDGFGDFLVRARGFDAPSGYGRVYLYAGGPTRDLSDLDVVTFDAVTTGAGFGEAMSGVGDVDGDGYDDFAIGDTTQDSVPQPGDGRVTLYSGGSSLGTLDSTEVQSTATNSYLGKSVGFGGDVNGDGYGDVVVLEPNHQSGGIVVGAVRVYPGPSFPASMYLDDGSSGARYDDFVE
jgi:hypothetical protein